MQSAARMPSPNPLIGRYRRQKGRLPDVGEVQHPQVRCDFEIVGGLTRRTKPTTAISMISVRAAFLDAPTSFSYLPTGRFLRYRMPTSIACASVPRHGIRPTIGPEVCSVSSLDPDTFSRRLPGVAGARRRRSEVAPTAASAPVYRVMAHTEPVSLPASSP